MHKISTGEWLRNVEDFLDRNPSIGPTSDENLCRIVAAEYYPSERFEEVMIKVATAFSGKIATSG